MRLELNSLAVQSFSTGTSPEPIDEPVPYTEQGGPESYCYICYPTGNTDPACQNDTVYYPCPLPDTYFSPCTQQLTCVGCA